MTTTAARVQAPAPPAVDAAKGFATPAEVAVLAVESGVAKANLPVSKMLVGGFLAGAYIAFASLLAVTTTAGLDVARWGTLPTLITGITFSLGLVLVIVAGGELLTGNMALLPMALLQKRITIGTVGVNFAVVLVGNLAGSVFVAYLLAVKSGVIGAPGTGAQANLIGTRLGALARGKAVTESDLQIFLRAVGCNWLVCLAVWMAMAAKDIGGKILAIVFPITAFVAMGFDHVVANMFFLPAAVFDHAGGVTFADTVNNLVIAFVGNLVGAALFVGGFYWFLYLRPDTSGRTAPARS